MDYEEKREEKEDDEMIKLEDNSRDDGYYEDSYDGENTNYHEFDTDYGINNKNRDRIKGSVGKNDVICI